MQRQTRSSTPLQGAGATTRSSRLTGDGGATSAWVPERWPLTIRYLINVFSTPRTKSFIRASSVVRGIGYWTSIALRAGMLWFLAQALWKWLSAGSVHSAKELSSATSSFWRHCRLHQNRREKFA